MKADVSSNTITLRVPFRVVKRGGRKEVRLPEGVRIPCRMDDTLIKALARAFRWKRMLDTGEFITITGLAKHEKIAPLLHDPRDTPHPAGARYHRSHP